MKKWGIALTLLAALSVTALSGCGGSNNKAAAEELLTVFTTQDAAQIYAASDAETQSTYTQEAIQERLDSFYKPLAVESVSYDNFKLDRGATTDEMEVYNVDVTVVTSSGTLTAPTQVAFTGTGEDTKIHWAPESIFSGWTMDNSLNIEVKEGERGTIYARDGEILATTGEDGVRSYPQGVVTSACVGYVRAATAEEIENGTVDSDTSIGTQVGRAGFEEAYNERLTAVSGLKVTLSDQPDVVLMDTEPQNGEDITTTIDLKVQQSAYDVVNGEFGAVVGIEPSTGQVLAMVDASPYDPTVWLDNAMTAEEYAANVENGVAPDEGTFAYTFTPGSTQKLLTTYIGFKAGTLTQESSYEIYGEDWAPPGGWGSYKVHRVAGLYGWEDLANALIYSDNIYFARVGLDMGYDNFNNGMTALGIGSEVPGAYNIQTSQINNIGGIEDGHETGLADSSYGQYQVKVSPLQQALIYASLQNGGNIMKPLYLIDEEPEIWIADVATQDNIDFINNALRSAVTVSHPNGDRDYAQFSGKTGTAEVGADGSTNLGWFCGADLANPTCTMCVMINYVENRGGSDVNTGYFGMIMDKVYADGPYVPSGLNTADEESLEEGEEAAEEEEKN